MLKPYTAPIGVFDSGLGGLSVVQQLQAKMPLEPILYFADTLHVPYGERSDSEIRELTAAAVHWLYENGCKAVVVACNTASAFSLSHLRDFYGETLPIIGLVPAVKPAVQATQTGHIGVLATQGTLRGSLLKDVIEQYAKPAGVTVHTAMSPLLVPFVERGQQHSQACYAELKQILAPLAANQVDQLVLGCTHYPFLAQAIETLYPNVFTLVDSGAAVARQTERILAHQHQLIDDPLHQYSKPPVSKNLSLTLRMVVTGSVAQSRPVVEQLLHHHAFKRPFMLQNAYHD